MSHHFHIEVKRRGDARWETVRSEHLASFIEAEQMREYYARLCPLNDVRWAMRDCTSELVKPSPLPAGHQHPAQVSLSAESVHALYGRLTSEGEFDDSRAR